MIKRRTAIVAFLLCACMVIGLGYAAISRELTLNGTLHAGARSDLEVWFVDATIPTLDGEATNMCTLATLNGTGKALTATMETESLVNVGDKAVAKFKIQNQETLQNAVHAKLYDLTFSLIGANSAFTDAEDYYDVTYSFVEDDANAALNDSDHSVVIGTNADDPTVDDLPPQHSVYLVVTVTLKKSVIDSSISHAANFTITLTAEATEGAHA